MAFDRQGGRLRKVGSGLLLLRKPPFSSQLYCACFFRMRSAGACDFRGGAHMFAIALALLAQSAAGTSLVQDGGVCVGLSWVKLASREQTSVDYGPDFSVYRFHGPNGEDDHWWGVYWGRHASVRPDGPILLRRDGVTIRRAFDDGKFQGYLAEKDGLQNHFFGSMFDGSATDMEFFERVDFGRIVQSLCAPHDA